MRVIDITKLQISDRQRSKIDPGPLNELRQSILDVGLLQPPGATHDPSTDTWRLVYGERRVRAIQLLQADGHSFACNGHSIQPGHLPVLDASDLSDIRAVEAELEENIIRVDLDWQDKARALATIHKLRQAQDPGHTKRDTIEEISTKTGTPASTVKRQLHDALIVAEHLADPKIAKARDAGEARQLIFKSEEEKYRAVLAKRTLARDPDKPALEIRHDDCLRLLPLLDPDQFDLILADPPYGIDAGSGGFRSRSVHHHNYEDSIDTARNVANVILTEGFRLTRPRANLFLFCHPRLWNWLFDAAANMGWTPYPAPIIWQKSESEGMAPWGSSGFRRTYDTILYATKNRGLLTSPVDILNVKRVKRHERIHAAEKPVELLRKLIECSTLPGDSILDPCCGSGSAIVAAKESGRRGLGIEKDEGYFNTALANLHRHAETDTEGESPESSEESLADV